MDSQYNNNNGIIRKFDDDNSFLGGNVPNGKVRRINETTILSSENNDNSMLIPRLSENIINFTNEQQDTKPDG